MEPAGSLRVHKSVSDLNHTNPVHTNQPTNQPTNLPT